MHRYPNYTLLVRNYIDTHLDDLLLLLDTFGPCIQKQLCGMNLSRFASRCLMAFLRSRMVCLSAVTLSILRYSVASVVQRHNSALVLLDGFSLEINLCLLRLHRLL